MTSRERIKEALRHKESDRVPIDLGSSRSSGINAAAYNRLKEYLGIDEPTYVYDVKQMLAIPSRRVLDYFGADVLQLNRLRASLKLRINRWKPVNFEGEDYLFPEDYEVVEEKGSLCIVEKGVVIAKHPIGGIYFDETFSPFLNAVSEADLPKVIIPPMSDEEADFIKKNLESLKSSELDIELGSDSDSEKGEGRPSIDPVFSKDGERALSGATGISIFEKGLKDFGYENFLVQLYINRPLVEAYLDRLVDGYLAFLEDYLPIAAGEPDVIQISDDHGNQRGLMIDPKIFREVFKPRYARLIKFIKKASPDVKVFLHSCGSVYRLIPDFIEMGVDILNPVQTEAEEMEPARLKREFGDDITFWGGGCGVQRTLFSGTVNDVRDEVKRMIDIFAPGGGYVFCPTHNIQPGTDPEKIVALFETALNM